MCRKFGNTPARPSAQKIKGASPCPTCTPREMLGTLWRVLGKVLCLKGPRALGVQIAQKSARVHGTFAGAKNKISVCRSPSLKNWVSCQRGGPPHTLNPIQPPLVSVLSLRAKGRGKESVRPAFIAVPRRILSPAKGLFAAPPCAVWRGGQRRVIPAPKNG